MYKIFVMIFLFFIISKNVYADCSVDLKNMIKWDTYPNSLVGFHIDTNNDRVPDYIYYFLVENHEPVWESGEDKIQELEDKYIFITKNKEYPDVIKNKTVEIIKNFNFDAINIETESVSLEQTAPKVERYEINKKCILKYKIER